MQNKLKRRHFDLFILNTHRGLSCSWQLAFVAVTCVCEGGEGARGRGAARHKVPILGATGNSLLSLSGVRPRGSDLCRGGLLDPWAEHRWPLLWQFCLRSYFTFSRATRRCQDRQRRVRRGCHYESVTNLNSKLKWQRLYLCGLTEKQTKVRILSKSISVSLFMFPFSLLLFHVCKKN